MFILIASIVMLSLGGCIIYYFYTNRTPVSHHALDPDLPITPYNTVIVFDIHGVLFKADYKNIIKTFLASPYKYIFIRYALYPPVWIDFIRLMRKESVFGKYVAHFTTKYPALSVCIPLVTTLANTQLPIPETIALLKQLHADGYTLHIFSNIGAPIMEDLAQKFPEIFRYFDAVKTPDATNNFTGKPHPTVFDEYLQETNVSHKQILFIDDKIKNLETAKTFGIIGIYFSDPESLKEKLHALGLRMG